MSMTKKDYEIVAKAMNAVLWHHESDPATTMAAISELSQAFERNYEAFDPQRFIEACCKSRAAALAKPVARPASATAV